MVNLNQLVSELVKQPVETEWLEFKHDNYSPETIGEDICALANGAALTEKPYAYFIWGVDDATHRFIGTSYNLQNLKKGNQEIENWLRSLLSSNADFEYQMTEIEGVLVGIMKIKAAIVQPVTFQRTPYIRVGSYTRKLADVPALQIRLWSRLSNSNFEDRTAKEHLDLHEALSYLDCSVYFDLLGLPLPSTIDAAAHYLLEDGILLKEDSGTYAITNLGAILLSKKISAFPSIARKAIRVVQYQGNNKLNMLREEVGLKGYVSGFEGLIKYIGALLPSKEVISEALREKETAYPELAVREAVANALIHQDFSIAGTGPTIEIFDRRIEITNSGTPLVDIMRIIDNPPRSRNEKLASIMRRLKMCEELGTGWDKMILSCELAHIPAPRIDLYEDSMKVTFYEKTSFSDLTADNRLWACYMHACIQYVQGSSLTNSSLRERFGLKDSSSGNISRLIKTAVDEQLIKPKDPDTAPRYMQYLPVWA